MQAIKQCPAWQLALSSALLLAACQTSKPPKDPGSLLTEAPAAAGSITCPPIGEDWLSSMPAQLRRIAPADCSQHTGTPLFAWGDARDRNAAQPYSLVVRQAGGSPVHSQADLKEARARLPKSLAPGNYEWTVAYTASNGGLQQAQWRRFSVGASDAYLNAHDLVEGSLVAAQVAARNRPRVLAPGMSFERLRTLASQSEQLPALALLRARAAAAQQAATLTSPPPLGGSSPLAQAQAFTQLVLAAHNERLSLEVLSVVARLDGNAAQLAAAKRRLFGLATWPVNGSTSEASASAANAELTQALAFGLDLLWNDLSPAERAQVLAPLRERLIQGSVAAFAQLDREPHAATALLRLRSHTQALLLATGTFPEAQSLLARAWELNRHSLQHWGTDGNQGPAIAQAWQQFAASTQFAAAVRTIAGTDLYELPVLRRSAEQLMAFTAPGAEQPAAFGDAAETRDLYERHVAALRLHAQQSRDVAALWYWQAKPANLSAPSDASVWQLLLLGVNAQPLPTGSTSLANDWFSKEAGLAAMHNDISSGSRSSVYFLSGPHGAYGAAQAEQNALAYVSQGRPLLVNAGSTPYIGSPHHRNTRATRFKNALTFDGGIGQAEGNSLATRPGDPLFNMDPSGFLIRAQSAGNYAAVTGDATAAYRAVDTTRNTWAPLLSNAVRSLVVDKSNGLTLLYDWATSATPRQWELNFHAPNPFISDAATVRSVNGNASVCLDRHGPATQFTQTSGWEVAPELPQPAPSRGRFSTLVRSTEFAHLTVLREGCRNVPLQVSQNGAKISVLINGRDQLQFERRALSIPVVGSTASSVTVAAQASGGNSTTTVPGNTNTGKDATMSPESAAALSALEQQPMTNVMAVAKSDLTAELSSDVSNPATSNWSGINCYGQYGNWSRFMPDGIHGTRLQDGRTQRFGLISDPTDRTRKVFELRVHKDDVLTSGAKRCEVLAPGAGSTALPVNKDFWFAFAIRIAEGAVTSGDDQLLAQWHVDGVPIFSLLVKDGRLRIENRFNANIAASPASTTLVTPWRDSVGATDRWMHFVVKARISPFDKDQPYISVWRNGTKLFDRRGPLGINSASLPFAKLGFYQWLNLNTWDAKVPVRTIHLRHAVTVLDPTNRYNEPTLRALIF